MRRGIPGKRCPAWHTQAVRARDDENASKKSLQKKLKRTARGKRRAYQ
jgi:hypothetical protein